MHYILMILVLAAAGCSKYQPPIPFAENPGLAPKTSSTASQIQIVNDTGLPIANAEVLIGQKKGSFAGNHLFADAQGLVNAPLGWQQAEPITVQAPGYVRLTLMNRAPGTYTLRLRLLPAVQKRELNGLTTGFGALKKDGFIDAGLVYPAMARSELLSFQMTSIVSPEVDTITAMGREIDLPSNITLPKQTENYVLPITFDKPRYRLPLFSSRVHTLVSQHTRFPLDKVVDGLQDGKRIFDLLEYFEFMEGSDTPLADQRSIQNDLPVNGQRYAKRVSVSAPPVDPTYRLLVLPLAETGTLLYPTDVKEFKANETRKLSFPENLSSGYLLSVMHIRNIVMRNTSGAGLDRLSAMLFAIGSPNGGTLLPIIPEPQYSAGVLSATVPASPPQLTATATVASMSFVEMLQAGKLKIEKKTPVWDIYAESWQDRLTLPEWPGSEPISRPGNANQRWEYAFLATQNGSLNVPLGPDMLANTTHVTKSAVDY